MPSSARPPAERAYMGIGALSRAVGIPVETLRTWERRYGFPIPERTPSGHRRYRADDVPRLRRVAALLARGIRAGEALPATDAEAEELLRASGAAVPPPWSNGPTTAPSTEVLLAAVRKLDPHECTRQLQAAWAGLGPLEFAAGCMPPLLGMVGDGWASGDLDIRHEHFLTERVTDLLRAVRLPLEAEAAGPIVVLATLPGEEHALGLQLASLVLVASGLRTVSAGAQLPEDEIVFLAQEVSAFAVGVSVSIANRGAGTGRRLARLRERLPRRIKMIVGGAGAPRARAGIEIFGDLRALGTWARRLGGRGA